MSIAGTVLRLALISVLCIALFQSTEGAILTVDHDGSETYLTIQDAIDNATDGDVIQVHNGTYYDPFEVDTEGITIEGGVTGNVIIDGQMAYDMGRVLSDRVTLMELEFTRADDGVRVLAVNDVTIRNCTFSDNEIGIFARNCSRLGIYDSDFDGHYYGIRQQGCVNSIMKGLILTNTTDVAISLFDAQVATIDRSVDRETIINGTYDGIIVDSGHNFLINCSIKGSRDRGFLMYDAVIAEINVVIEKASGNGIEIDSVHDLSVNGSVDNCTGIGISLYEVLNSIIDIDIINNTGNGFYIYKSESITVSGSVGSGGRCFDIRDSSDIGINWLTVRSRDMEDHVAGIFLWNGSNVIADNIKFEGMGTALWLDEYSNITVTNLSADETCQNISYRAEGSSHIVLFNPEHPNWTYHDTEVTGDSWISIKNTIDLEVLMVNEPVPKADVEVENSEGVFYETQAFGGWDNRTDDIGRVYSLTLPYLFIRHYGAISNVTRVHIMNGSKEYQKNINPSATGLVTLVLNSPPEIHGDIHNQLPIRSNKRVHFTAYYQDENEDEPSKHNVVIDNDVHQMTPNGTLGDYDRYSFNITLDRGDHWYRFEFRDDHTFVSTENVNFTVSNTRPELATYDVDEDLPYWVFEVRYRDYEGDPAVDVRLIIDDANYTMNRSESSPNWEQGVWYNVSVPLENGLHSYHFKLFDGTDWSYPGYTYTINVYEHRPSLSNLTITPASGDSSERYRFQVVYSHDIDKYPNNDFEGNLTLFVDNRTYSMRTRSSGTPSSGITYYDWLYLKEGEHEFQVKASDGTFTVFSEIGNITVVNSAPRIVRFDVDPPHYHETSYWVDIDINDRDKDPLQSLTLEIDGIRFGLNDSDETSLWDIVSNSRGSIDDGDIRFWFPWNFTWGTHYYRIDVSDGTLNSSLVGEFTRSSKPSILVHHYPVFSDNSTPTVFICNYSDEDNGRPENITIQFNGSSSGINVTLGPFPLEEVDRNDEDTWDGKSYGFLHRFDPGTYTYNVWASDGNITKVSSLDNFAVVKADYPILRKPSISPINGSTGTVFTVSINYSHRYGSPPDQLFVRIDGVDYDMDNYHGLDHWRGMTYYAEVTFPYSSDFNISIVGITDDVTSVKTIDRINISVYDPPPPSEDKGDWIDLPSAFILSVSSLLLAILFITVYEGYTRHRTRWKQAERSVYRLTTAMITMRRKGVVFDRRPIMKAKILFKEEKYPEAEKAAQTGMSDLRVVWNEFLEARDSIDYIEENRGIIPGEHSEDVEKRINVAKKAFMEGKYAVAIKKAHGIRVRIARALKEKGTSTMPVEVSALNDDEIKLAEMPYGDDIEDDIEDFDGLGL